jgi:hypothetical protein
MLCKTRCLGHLECWNKLCNYFILNGNPNEIVRIGNIVHVLTQDRFTFGLPYCKICNVVSFVVNTGVVCMYYVVHKHKNLIWVTIHLGMHEHPVVEGM